MTINLKCDEYLPYVEFKTLPTELKAQYLQYIVDNYHVGYLQIAQMWGGEVSKETLRKRFDSLGIVASIPHGCQVKKEDKLKFLEHYKKPGARRRLIQEESPTQEKATPTYCSFVENIDGSLTFKYTKDESLDKLVDSFRNFLTMFPDNEDFNVQVIVKRRYTNG